MRVVGVHAVSTVSTVRWVSVYIHRGLMCLLSGPPPGNVPVNVAHVRERDVCVGPSDGVLAL
eukprot:8995461-Pyramimonas_sp.AAC.1